jgi:hypothetical protein
MLDSSRKSHAGATRACLSREVAFWRASAASNADIAAVLGLVAQALVLRLERGALLAKLVHVARERAVDDEEDRNRQGRHRAEQDEQDRGRVGRAGDGGASPPCLALTEKIDANHDVARSLLVVGTAEREPEPDQRLG